MAEEFHTGVCSTMSWYAPPSFSCSSTAIRDISNESIINWNQPFLQPTEFGQMDANPSREALSFLPGFFDQDANMKHLDYPEPAAAWAKLDPQFFDAQQMSFSNITSTTATQLSETRANFVMPTPFITEPKFEDDHANCRNLTRKSSATKEDRSEPPTKKPRIEVPSPLPTFKVRKEKLGDRITALQQLVSPFGKTDTASVLQEAIEYIKYLHEQVGFLSSPYLKNGHQVQNQIKSLERAKNGDEELNQNLGSQGLCLVPISSTFDIAREYPMDFWTPNFGGSYI